MIQSGKWSIGLVLMLAASVASAAEKYDLSVKFSEGKSQYIERSASINTQVQMGQGGAMTVAAEVISGFIESVESASDEGTTLELRYDRQMMKINHPMPMIGTQSYDSDLGEDEKSPMLRQVFDRMIGKSLKMELDTDNKVKSLTGMDEIRDEVAKGTGQNLIARDMVKNMGNDLAAAEWGIARFAFVPTKKVEVGESWTNSREQPTADGTMIYDGTYTLDEVKDVEYEGKPRKTAVISFVEKIKPGKQAPPAPMTPRFKSGERSGVIHFDLKRRRVFKQTAENKHKLTMSNPMGGGDVPVDMTVHETQKMMPLKSREAQRAASKKSTTEDSGSEKDKAKPASGA